MLIEPVRLLMLKFLKEPTLTYVALKAFVEKERPDWIRALIPRNIDAGAEYRPQKVLALSAIQGVLCNQIAQDLGKKLDPAFGTVEAQMGHLLEYEVPTFCVSKELLAAAARTDLPGELLLDAVPFPFPALVFMLPKGTIRHPIGGDCPYVVVSRTEKEKVTSLPLKDMAILLTTPFG
jgi:hypothetical protein